MKCMVHQLAMAASIRKAGRRFRLCRQLSIFHVQLSQDRQESKKNSDIYVYTSVCTCALHMQRMMITRICENSDQLG